jgi:hypothetical protein
MFGNSKDSAYNPTADRLPLKHHRNRSTIITSNIYEPVKTRKQMIKLKPSPKKATDLYDENVYMKSPNRQSSILSTGQNTTRTV